MNIFIGILSQNKLHYSEILYNVEILGKCYNIKEISELIALNQFGDAL